MLVNLSDVLTSEGRQISVEVPLEMTHFKKGKEFFKIIRRSPVEIRAVNLEPQKARVTGKAELVFHTRCDRCLTEVETELCLDFERIVKSPEVAIEDEDADDLSFMDGYQLDVEAFVYHEIIGNWPAKILCKEECKGLCLVCGQNRNLVECGCNTFVPDPRMAVIQDIFNANKEV